MVYNNDERFWNGPLSLPNFNQSSTSLTYFKIREKSRVAGASGPFSATNPQSKYSKCGSLESRGTQIKMFPVVFAWQASRNPSGNRPQFRYLSSASVNGLRFSAPFTGLKAQVVHLPFWPHACIQSTPADASWKITGFSSSITSISWWFRFANAIFTRSNFPISI